MMNTSINWHAANTFLTSIGKRLPFGMLIVGLVVSTPHSAYAQSESDDGGLFLDEVVVTAQRREEKLQDVPIAVTAISGESLSNKGIQAVTDLVMVAPGLSYTTQAGQAAPRIRGVGTALAGAGVENAVATYVDGVYYASALGAVLSFNNIDQLAVLKGPQGTLFGRNATGGLIQITTRDPGQDFVGNVGLTVGDLDTVGADVYLSGGVSDSVAADLAVRYFDQGEGFGINQFNGQDVGNSKELSARSKWIFDVGSATEATLILDYTDTEYAGAAFRPMPGATHVTGVPFTGGDFDINADAQPFSNVEQYGASVKLHHEFATMDFISISAFRNTKWNTLFDSDASPFDIVSARVTVPDEQISQEFQLLSTGGDRLNWVVGLYYYEGEGGFGPGVVASPPGDFVLTLNTKTTTESYSVYGQGTYALTDTTGLTLGLRFTSETQDFDASGTFFINSLGFGIPQGPSSGRNEEKEPTWRLALDHQLTEDTLIYASYNRGFKTGGFETTTLTSAESFNPEVLDAYEIGLKSEILDRRVRINSAAYYYDYKDMQLNQFINGLTAVYNGESATIYGADIDVVAVASERLMLTFGASLIHGRFNDFPISVTDAPPAGGVTILPDISADGKHIPLTPDYTFNIGVDYEIPLANGGVTLATDLFRSDSWFNDPDNRTSQDAYSLVNASATWRSGDDERYTLKLWGRNLGDTARAMQITNQVGIVDMMVMGPGRTYGVTFGINSF